MLVPEIGMTPQALSRFTSRFGERVAVLHSRLGAGERRDEWHRLRTGEATICVGPRSAIFAPVASPGLIVIDEEHDGSYKQEGDPRYDAREVARRRAADAGAALVAGSATPRPESWLALERIELAAAGRRASPAAGRGARHARSRRSRGPAAPAHARGARGAGVAGRQGDRARQPPRLGAASVLPRVRARLAVPATATSRSSSCIGSAACAVITAASASRRPRRARSAARSTLARAGAGSERVEQALAELAAPMPVFRLDSDTAAGAGGHLEILAPVRGRRRRASWSGPRWSRKGHDFPDVVLAVVLDADATLRFPDFRAEERTFALVAQLAGRSGRGERAGRVLVQTLAPEAAAIRHAARHDAAGFLEGELERRRELGYPPFSHLIRVELDRAGGAGGRGGRGPRSATRSRPSCRRTRSCLGPAPRFRLRGRERRQLLVKAPERGAAGGRRARRGRRRGRAPASWPRLQVAVDVDAAVERLPIAPHRLGPMSETAEQRGRGPRAEVAEAASDGDRRRGARAPGAGARRGAHVRRPGAALAGVAR